MPLNGASIANSPTISISGGTAVTLTSNGMTVKNGIQLIDAAVTDFRVRPVLTVQSTPPALDKATGKWSKGKKSISITAPKILADGTQEFPNITVAMKDHPENTPAEQQKLREWAIQALQNADFSKFWSAGSVA